MEPNYQQARNLYAKTDLTQVQIAAIIGVSAKTIYRWISKDNWKRYKDAARHIPAAVVERLYTQLFDLNDGICARGPGQRIPTKEEADINRKLITGIDKMKKQITLSDNIEVMQNFITYVSSVDLTLAQKITRRADEFLQKKTKNDRHPYQMDYDLEVPEDAAEDVRPFPEALVKEEEPEVIEEVEPEQTEEEKAEAAERNGWRRHAYFEVRVNGFWKEENCWAIPEDTGAFFVYEAKEIPGSLAIEPQQLLYISETTNARKSIEEILKTVDWQAQLQSGNILAFAVAKTASAHRRQIAAAYIHNTHPILNPESEKPFPYKDTEITTLNDFHSLSKCFLVKNPE